MEIAAAIVCNTILTRFVQSRLTNLRRFVGVVVEMVQQPPRMNAGQRDTKMAVKIVKSVVSMGARMFATIRLKRKTHALVSILPRPPL